MALKTGWEFDPKFAGRPREESQRRRERRSPLGELSEREQRQQREESERYRREQKAYKGLPRSPLAGERGMERGERAAREERLKTLVEDHRASEHLFKPSGPASEEEAVAAGWKPGPALRHAIARVGAEPGPEIRYRGRYADTEHGRYYIGRAPGSGGAEIDFVAKDTHTMVPVAKNALSHDVERIIERHHETQEDTAFARARAARAAPGAKPKTYEVHHHYDEQGKSVKVRVTVPEDAPRGPASEMEAEDERTARSVERAKYDARVGAGRFAYSSRESREKFLKDVDEHGLDMALLRHDERTVHLRDPQKEQLARLQRTRAEKSIQVGPRGGKHYVTTGGTKIYIK